MRSGATAGSLKDRTRNVTSAKQSSFGRRLSRCRNRQDRSDHRSISPRSPCLRVSPWRSPVLGSRFLNQAYDVNTGLVSAITAGPAQSVANFSYAFDTIGNLASRADTFQGTTEQFCYDNLNRLTDSAFVSGGSTCTTGTGRKTVSYSAIGNILSKTGTGSYGYPASGGGAGSRPHAVSSVTGTVNGVVNPAYSYDANGNMTAGAGRTVAWTAFNMAAAIVQGANAYAFSYDSEHQRIKQVAPRPDHALPQRDGRDER